MKTLLIRDHPGGFAPPAPPTRSLAGPQCPAPLAWLTRCARSLTDGESLSDGSGTRRGRGSAPLPDALRELIGRGSTSLQERNAADVQPGPALDADRVVFWAARADDDLRDLAKALARAVARRRREVIVFVTPDGSGVDGLADTETFTWPGDEDRLKMAFMTGA